MSVHNGRKHNEINRDLTLEQARDRARYDKAEALGYVNTFHLSLNDEEAAEVFPEDGSPSEFDEMILEDITQDFTKATEKVVNGALDEVLSSCSQNAPGMWQVLDDFRVRILREVRNPSYIPTLPSHTEIKSTAPNSSDRYAKLFRERGERNDARFFESFKWQLLAYPYDVAFKMYREDEEVYEDFLQYAWGGSSESICELHTRIKSLREAVVECILDNSRLNV